MNLDYLRIGFLVLSFSLSPASAFEAAPLHMPQAFDAPVAKGKAVFIDIQSAQYSIEFRTAEGKALAHSEIQFKTDQEGMPILDLIPNPTKVTLDGEDISTLVVKDAEKSSDFRLLLKTVPAGDHKVIVEHQISSNVTVSKTEARSAFWTSDLDDREFLEQYLPTNLEYDLYPMSLKVEVVGTSVVHKVFTNADLKINGVNSWQIQTPDTFNASALFFHLAPETNFAWEERAFEKSNGEKMVVTVYAKADHKSSIKKYADTAVATLKELDGDYGPFRHPRLVVYASPFFGGGMEYMGATITNLFAIEHEITHSYFGRGLIPARGNAGWVDEALASWRDNGYQALKAPGFTKSQMGAHSDYVRWTDGNAYTLGRDFIGHLSLLSNELGNGKSLKGFLKEWIEKSAFSPFRTQDFQGELEAYFEKDLKALFDPLIYGKTAESAVSTPSAPRGTRVANPYHPELTREVLENLL